MQDILSYKLQARSWIKNFGNRTNRTRDIVNFSKCGHLLRTIVKSLNSTIRHQIATFWHFFAQFDNITVCVYGTWKKNVSNLFSLPLVLLNYSQIARIYTLVERSHLSSFEKYDQPKLAVVTVIHGFRSQFLINLNITVIGCNILHDNLPFLVWHENMESHWRSQLDGRQPAFNLTQPKKTTLKIAVILILFFTHGH